MKKFPLLNLHIRIEEEKLKFLNEKVRFSEDFARTSSLKTCIFYSFDEHTEGGYQPRTLPINFKKEKKMIKFNLLKDKTKENVKESITIDMSSHSVTTTGSNSINIGRNAGTTITTGGNINIGTSVGHHYVTVYNPIGVGATLPPSIENRVILSENNIRRMRQLMGI